MVPVHCQRTQQCLAQLLWADACLRLSSAEIEHHSCRATCQTREVCRYKKAWCRWSTRSIVISHKKGLAVSILVLSGQPTNITDPVRATQNLPSVTAIRENKYNASMQDCLLCCLANWLAAWLSIVCVGCSALSRLTAAVLYTHYLRMADTPSTPALLPQTAECVWDTLLQWPLCPEAIADPVERGLEPRRWLTTCSWQHNQVSKPPCFASR